MTVLSMWGWVIKHEVYLLSIILWKYILVWCMNLLSTLLLPLVFPAIWEYTKWSLLLSLLFYSSSCTAANANISFRVWKVAYGFDVPVLTCQVLGVDTMLSEIIKKKIPPGSYWGGIIPVLSSYKAWEMQKSCWSNFKAHIQRVNELSQ